jgi:excisionase family DNA binding protein
MMRALLSVRQVSELLGLSVSSVWRHVARGHLPQPVRIGGSTRWRRADIEALLGQEAA